MTSVTVFFFIVEALWYVFGDYGIRSQIHLLATPAPPEVPRVEIIAEINKNFKLLFTPVSNDTEVEKGYNRTSLYDFHNEKIQQLIKIKMIKADKLDYFYYCFGLVKDRDIMDTRALFDFTGTNCSKILEFNADLTDDLSSATPYMIGIFAPELAVQNTQLNKFNGFTRSVSFTARFIYYVFGPNLYRDVKRVIDEIAESIQTRIEKDKPVIEKIATSLVNLFSTSMWLTILITLTIVTGQFFILPAMSLHFLLNLCVLHDYAVVSTIVFGFGMYVVYKVA
jgi:hypothetical protein